MGHLDMSAGAIDRIDAAIVDVIRRGPRTGVPIGEICRRLEHLAERRFIWNRCFALVEAGTLYWRDRRRPNRLLVSWRER